MPDSLPKAIISPPQQLESPAETFAAIHLVVPRDEIKTVMGPALHEIFEALAEQQLAPSGRWLTYHLRRPTDTFDFYAAVPISGDFQAKGRVFAITLPEARVARCTYQGPYEGLCDAWGAFVDWMEAAGHSTQAAFWERYLIGPDSTDDESAWLTELNVQLHL